MAQADGHADDLGIHYYETPRGTFAIGVPLGDKRPAVWAITSTGPFMLGRLNGEVELKTLVMLFDAAFHEINRVTDTYITLAGDPNGKQQSRSKN